MCKIYTYVGVVSAYKYDWTLERNDITERVEDNITLRKNGMVSLLGWLSDYNGGGDGSC